MKVLIRLKRSEDRYLEILPRRPFGDILNTAVSRPVSDFGILLTRGYGVNPRAPTASCKPAQEGGIVDEKLKRLVEELGSAIKASISGSEQMQEVIANIEGSGYEVSLVFNARIAINKWDPDPASLPARTNGTVESRFNSQDVQFLKSMHISVNG
jgi:hypothetical protein